MIFMHFFLCSSNYFFPSVEQTIWIWKMFSTTTREIKNTKLEKILDTNRNKDISLYIACCMSLNVNSIRYIHYYYLFMHLADVFCP